MNILDRFKKNNLPILFVGNMKHKTYIWFFFGGLIFYSTGILWQQKLRDPLDKVNI